MSVSAVNSFTQASVATTSTAAANAKAADGDYKTPGRNTAKVKDTDGDYKPLKSSAVASSSNGVLAALSSLKKGG